MIASSDTALVSLFVILNCHDVGKCLRELFNSFIVHSHYHTLTVRSHLCNSFAISCLTIASVFTDTCVALLCGCIAKPRVQ